ncbi:chymotrypsin family serine protease [Pseudoxanthomonas sangjuensis]
MAASLNEVRRVHAGACNGLLARRNVVAVGVGYKRTGGRATGGLAIVCSVRAKRPLESLALRDRIPATVQGVPTDVVQSGPIFAQQSRTGRVRPAPGGVSIGHIGITAGTLGCLVLKSGNPHILSNNHVLANSNDASVGDAILQPGPADGGRDPADQIARLVEWAPIVFDGADGDGNGGGDGGESPCPIGGIAAGMLNAAAAAVGSRTRLRAVREAAPAATNLVDCAIAAPLDPSSVSADILEIGRIAGVADGGLGMPIRKSGRTTGLTTGEIEQVDVTAQVDYGSGRTATFTDQLMAGAMSQGGDSGSAIFDMDNRLVGLLFAGSTNTTVINRIQNVFAALQVDLP